MWKTLQFLFLDIFSNFSISFHTSRGKSSRIQVIQLKTKTKIPVSIQIQTINMILSVYAIIMIFQVSLCNIFQFFWQKNQKQAKTHKKTCFSTTTKSNSCYSCSSKKFKKIILIGKNMNSNSWRNYNFCCFFHSFFF